MSVGYGLLKSVIHQGPGALVSLSDKGITNDIFQGEERIVFSAIEQFYLSYGELPTLDTIEVSSGIKVPWDNFPIEPLDYWIDQVKERSLLLQAGTILSQAQDAMGRRDLLRLRECIQNVYIQLEESRNDYSVQSIKEAAQEVIDLHNRVQQNPIEIPGIPFAFPYLNLVSGGMGGGDIISLIGRPSTCKSYVILDEARHAHSIGEKVLFISMEMPISQCARRLSALRTGLNYNRLRFGRVSSFGIRRLEEDVVFMDSQESFQWLSGGIFGTIDRIYAQIKHYHPSIVYIDGAYLIRTSAKGGQRWERILHVLEVLKQIALTENIPIYITFQFNKTAPGTLEGVAYSDGVAQLSSIAISLDTEGVEDSTLSLPVQYRTLKLLKGREGETGKIRIELDFNRMVFSQNTVLSGMTNDFELEDAEENFGNERDNMPIAFI